MIILSPWQSISQGDFFTVNILLAPIKISLYNHYMTFLTISDSESFITQLQETIKSIDKKAKVYSSDFANENLLKIKKYFNSASLCIIFSAAACDKLSKQKANDLSYISGIINTNKIQLLTNLDFLIPDYAENKKLLVKMGGKDEVFSYITKKYKSLVKQDNVNSAKKALFNKGIPFTPDCFAASIAKNKAEICKLFISAGIDINSRDDLGTPMLNVAVRNDNIELTKMLLEYGADINAVSNDRGYTAVMDAVWKGNKDITKLLIEQGAELNTISKEGQSNLVLAVGANNIAICKILAENGADPDIKDQMGMSAYNYASLFKKVQIQEILKPYHKE